MKPICPHCKTELTPFDFEGYYDSFSGWFCKCKQIPKSVKMRGSYAGSLEPHYEEVMEIK
jgi:hypothetical protein